MVKKQVDKAAQLAVWKKVKDVYSGSSEQRQRRSAEGIDIYCTHKISTCDTF